jgi:hypothetical protein
MMTLLHTIDTSFWFFVQVIFEVAILVYFIVTLTRFIIAAWKGK